MSKVGIVVGCNGQDGSYLTELLLEKGYEVHGVIRRASQNTLGNIEQVLTNPNLHLHYLDLNTSEGLAELVEKADEVYNLAAQSHVGISFNIPEYTGDVTGLGATRLLEAIRHSGRAKEIKYYQACTSEQFGASPSPQNEDTPMHPQSPYAIAKLYAYWMTKIYRTGYGMFAVNGILFNHESPRRGENFVTRKITKAVARIALGKQKELRLGNLDPERDWGYSPEYMEIAWRMLQQDQPDDYVIGTEETHTIRDFVDAAFKLFGLDWHDYVIQDQAFMRPNDVNHLQADCSKAKRLLGWNPTVKMAELVEIMVDADWQKESES